MRRLGILLERLLKENEGHFKNIVAYLIAGDRMRLKLLKEHISSVEVSEKMDMVQFLAEKARREGEATGILKGKAEGAIEIAKNMLIQKLSIADAAKWTGLSEEQVEEIQSELLLG